MSADDIYFGIPQISRSGASILPLAWQATADDMAKCVSDETPAETTDAVQLNARKIEHRITTMNRLFMMCKDEVTALMRSVGDIDKALAAPRAELDLARVEIERLKRQNASIVKESQRQKARADAAEKQAEEALEQAQKHIETPEAVFFIRRRTPGDSVRYLASEVMKHAEGNLELAGLAMALKMVAVDVDSLPQGSQ